MTVGTLLGPVAIAASPSLTEDELVREISARMDRVPQFKFIRDEAKKLGVKVYLFGGTAAGFAHYVRWDLLREKGDQSYLKAFFDYDFFSIYRSTQDLDIVVDGPRDKAAELGNRLREKYPSFQGSKEQWEVRLLRETVGEKRALLGDADFNKQHSDSNSTGLIELTRSGEPLVRDLRAWDEPHSRFLDDIVQGKITYYFSSEHETTARYQMGKNPPIFSVIRYLTKAFQYGLELRPEDLVTVKRIIDAFDPANPGRGIKLDANDFEYWMHGNESKVSNAKKLFQHAIDIERAWDTLEELGLRQKLIALKTRSKLEGTDTLAVMMSREPLRSRPLGSGNGKTAAELGIEYVAHETRTPLALESITRSKQGWVNAFISRNGHAGEAAAYGDGFYTKIGNEGAAGTGLTIRFRVDPRARLGTDFTIDRFASDYVVFKNKRALHIIPESLDARLDDWFKVTLMAGPKNLGLLLRLDKRLQAKWTAATPEERDRVRAVIAGDLAKTLSGPVTEETAQVLSAWFKQSFSTMFVEAALEFVKVNPAGFHELSFLGMEHWRKHESLPRLVEVLMKHPSAEYLFAQAWFRDLMMTKEAVALPQWETWMKFGKHTSQTGFAVGQVLAHANSRSHPRWREMVEHHLMKGTPIMPALGSTAAFDSSPQWDFWMKLIFESDLYVPQAHQVLLTERARKDRRWWKWFESYAMKCYQKGEGLSPMMNDFSHSKLFVHDARWIAFARKILQLPENHPLTAEERSLHPRYRDETDLTNAKAHVAIAPKFDEALLKTDLIELGLRTGDPVVIRNIQWNVFEHGKLADRPDLFVLWIKKTPRRWGGPPKGTGDVFKFYVNHPAFKGVIPMTPGWLFALVDKGWDVRDGRFQAPERSKPLVPFLPKPRTCPALFVK